MAGEISEYYRSGAIAGFITEQYCTGEKYAKKYDGLIVRALHADYCARNKIPYVLPHDDEAKIEAYLSELTCNFEDWCKRMEQS